MPPLRLTTTALAVGGEAVARHPDGRVVFVAGALPGEEVDVELVEAHERWARGVATAVLAPSPDRREPPCPHRLEGCGGCDLLHATPEAQRRLKATLVAEVLARAGRPSGGERATDAHPVVEEGPALPEDGFRTTVRAGVVGGRAGLRRARSHDLVAVDGCAVAHPLVEELLVEGRFGDATEVTLRAGAATGERLALLTPTAEGARLPADVVVVGADELRSGRRAWYHDEVAGRRYRISAGSFFQSRADGAAALVAEVRRAVGPLPAGAAVVDAYGGVGLFAVALAGPAGGGDGAAGPGPRVTLVERSASSVADARVNLAGTSHRVIRADVARWRPSPADVVVADPARAGLGRRAVAALARTGAPTLVLVSCDPGALGRDAGLLAGVGYELERAVVVDLFPHTHHVEVVSTWRLTSPPGRSPGP